MWSKLSRLFAKALPYIIDAVAYIAKRKQAKNDQQEEVTPPEE